MGVAHVDECGIGKVVSADFGEPGLSPSLAIRSPSAVGFVRPTQHQHIDHAPPTHFTRGGRIASGGPHARMRLLPRARPNVDVPVGKMLALPTKRSLLVGESFGDQVNRFPKAFNVDNRVGVVGRHLAAARLDKTDLQPPSGNDIRGRVLLRDPHRFLPQRHQGA